MNDTTEKLPAWLGPVRLAIGLAQGFGLFWLHRAEEFEYWPALQPPLFGALSLVLAFAPLIVIGGLAALRWQTLAAWATGASALLAWLGWHEMARDVDQHIHSLWPVQAYAPAAAIVFVGHHLVAAGDEARRFIAPYERYFDLGWRHGAQLALSVAFTGAFWLLLYLGASLFRVIGITFVEELIQKDWFYFPATTTAFAAAIHLTDLRSGLVRGFRSLGLTLLSWLSPVMTGLGAAFLIALPFTGLEPLWSTRSAGAILLSAAAALIVLINATYQDGGGAASTSRVLRWSARVAAVLLLPLVGLAAYALYLRIDQHGLSPERIVAAALILVGAGYALFYLAAAFARPWMKLLEIGNIVSAFVVLGVLTAIFTPIADPARIAVADQINRLRSGAVSAAKFDVVFLQFESGRYGRDALAQLLAGGNLDPTLADRARRVASFQSAWEARNDDPDFVFAREARAPAATDEPPPRFSVIPEGAALPQSFVDQMGGDEGDLFMCRNARTPCEATVLDVSRDGAADVLLLVNRSIWVYSQDEGGSWRFVARGELRCRGLRNAVRTGDIQVSPPDMDDVTVDGVRITLAPAGERADCYGD